MHGKLYGLTFPRVARTACPFCLESLLELSDYLNSKSAHQSFCDYSIYNCVSIRRSRGSVSSRYGHIRAQRSFDTDNVCFRSAILVSEQLALWRALTVGRAVSLRCWIRWRLTVDLVHTKGNPFSPRGRAAGICTPLRPNPRNNLKTDATGELLPFGSHERTSALNTGAVERSQTRTSVCLHVQEKNIKKYCETTSASKECLFFFLDRPR